MELFISPCKVVQMFACVNDILKCEQSRFTFLWCYL